MAGPAQGVHRLVVGRWVVRARGHRHGESRLTDATGHVRRDGHGPRQGADRPGLDTVEHRGVDDYGEVDRLAAEVVDGVDGPDDEGHERDRRHGLRGGGEQVRHGVRDVAGQRDPYRLDLGGDPGDVVTEVAHPGEDVPRGRQQRCSGRREPDTARATVEEPHTPLPLAPLDALRERRLGHPELVGGMAEVPLLGHGHEVAQVPHEIHGSRVARRPYLLAMSKMYSCTLHMCDTTTVMAGMTTHAGPRRGRTVALAAVLVLALTAGLWVAQDWLVGDDEARAAADEVAAGITDGTLPAAAADTATAQRGLDEQLDGMGGLRPTVDVTDVDVDGDSATARLDVAWSLGGDGSDWTYTSELPLQRDDDTWRATVTPQVLVPALRQGERVRLTRDPAARGRILGRGGEVLVQERPVVRVGIDKTKVEPGDDVRSARDLAKAAGVEPGPFADAVEAAGDSAFVEAVVLREDDEDLAEVREAADDITGALLVDDELPLAPTRTFAAEILGRVGPATAEIVEESDGAVAAGDEVGLSGLQRTHEDTLGGQDGYRVEAVDSEDETRELTSAPVVDGQDLETTLASEQQNAAEDVLADVEPASAIVALDVTTGDVLAAANGPGSDGFATATEGRYAPGSTFKVVSALALLRGGATPETSLACPETITAGGRSFRNYSDFPDAGLGSTTLAEAIATSCNTALIGARDQITDGGLQDAAGSLGLTATPSLGVPAAQAQVPEAAADVDLAASVIGQGEVLSSPLGMATVAASVERGALVRPRLVPSEAASEEPSGIQELTSTEVGQLRSLMRGVVTEGTASFLADEGGDVIAKTGTAEYGDDDPPRTHAWMIAVQDEVAYAVFVEDGDGGAGTAGPLLEEHLAAL